MNVFQLAVLVVEALEAENIPYLVTGAISVNVFGIPRGTKDVDIVIALETLEPLNRLESRLAGVLWFDPQVSFETITGSLRHILKTKSRPPLTVELFELGTDAFVQSRFGRRRLEFSAQLNRNIWLPTPEDIVVQKLRWARSKDIDDARDVLAVQTLDKLDMPYIERWCAEHGTTERLRAVIESIPPDLR
jgi:hypothetical protein